MDPAEATRKSFPDTDIKKSVSYYAKVVDIESSIYKDDLRSASG